MGTVTSKCRGKFSLPGRPSGRFRIAKKPQGQTPSLCLNGLTGGGGRCLRSQRSLNSCVANKLSSQYLHQSVKPHCTTLATGLHMQFVHKGSTTAGMKSVITLSPAFNADSLSAHSTNYRPKVAVRRCIAHALRSCRWYGVVPGLPVLCTIYARQFMFVHP
jgi:hypothetical protein